MGAADPPGEIGMPGIDAGVDERDAHARPLGARVSTGDAERHEIALQVIERIVVGRDQRGRSREGMKLVERLRQHDARILRERSQHLRHRAAIDDLVYYAVYRERLDRPACHFMKGVGERYAVCPLLRALSDAVTVAAVAAARGARRT